MRFSSPIVLRKTAMSKAAFYFGKVCEKHPALGGKRHSSNRKCYGCGADATAAWRKANPEKAKAYSAEYLPKWLKANADKVRADGAKRMREWRLKNAEKVKQLANSPEMVAYRAARRAAERRATPSWANEFFIQQAYEIASVRTKVTGIKWQVDHIVPLKSDRVCGLHWEGNFQVIPAKLNSAKGNRHWPNM